MKKTLKLVGLFMVAVTVIIVGALSIYFLIENNKTYYIYDVRIVEPDPDIRYYIYTDNTITYTSKKNQVVYMTNKNSNRFEIAVYAHTSNGTTDVDIYPSDENIAAISYRNGRCYVEYKQAGVVQIIATVGGVSDEITVYVYDKPAEELVVYDDAFYGEEYKEYYPNRIVSYADSNLYSYRFEATSFVGGEFSENINFDNLQVEYDKDIFEDVFINSSNQTLNVQCKSKRIVMKEDESGELQPTEEDIKETNDAPIYIQSFYTVGQGSAQIKNIVKNYVVNVHIVADTPEYLQILLGTTPDFENKSVYVFTQNYDDRDVSIDDKDIINEILSNQKEITYLEAQSEKEFYKIFFTDRVDTLYIRIRKVYTNGSIVYLNPLTLDPEENPFTIIASNDVNFTVSANQNYYVLKLTKDYFDTNENFTISVKLDDYDLQKDFVFEYRSLTIDNVYDFYKYDEETGIYTYYYWDPRTEFNNEIYDNNGNIVGFTDMV